MQTYNNGDVDIKQILSKPPDPTTTTNGESGQKDFSGHNQIYNPFWIEGNPKNLNGPHLPVITHHMGWVPQVLEEDGEL